MAGIIRNGQQLGSVRVEDPKPKATKKAAAAEVAVEDAQAPSAVTKAADKDK